MCETCESDMENYNKTLRNKTNLIKTETNKVTYGALGKNSSGFEEFDQDDNERAPKNKNESVDSGDEEFVSQVRFAINFKVNF